jgi:hypothetical protein
MVTVRLFADGVIESAAVRIDGRRRMPVLISARDRRRYVVTARYAERYHASAASFGSGAGARH